MILRGINTKAPENCGLEGLYNKDPQVPQPSNPPESARRPSGRKLKLHNNALEPPLRKVSNIQDLVVESS